VAAVSDAGGLGSIGSVFESAENVERQIARVRELTSKPFAVNHMVPLLDEEAFKVTRREAEWLRGELMSVVRERKPHELVPFTGQTAGMIHNVLPAGEIVREMVSEAEQALQRTSRLLQ
jgi:NAD(P)H-dependent flavin oxidoreductase YrpB (nitropropane dioxygenase family)